MKNQIERALLWASGAGVAINRGFDRLLEGRVAIGIVELAIGIVLIYAAYRRATRAAP